jgi:hypothetical protein
MGAPAYLPRMRACRLLRFVEKQARHQTLPRDQPPDCPVVPTRRGLALVLHRPGGVVGRCMEYSSMGEAGTYRGLSSHGPFRSPICMSRG